MKRKTTTKKKAKPKHYGTMLEEALKSQGRTKVWAAKELGFSRVWLDDLIRTGNFTEDSLVIVKRIIQI